MVGGGQVKPQDGCQFRFQIEGGEFHHELIEMNESVQNSRFLLFNKWIKTRVCRRLIFGSLSMFNISWQSDLYMDFVFTEIMKQVCYPSINHQVDEHTALMADFFLNWEGMV